MHDDLILQPDLNLILGPDDEAHYVGPAADKGLGGYWAVVHRSNGLWTHLYRIAQDPHAPRLLVHMAAYFEGDSVAEARCWVDNKKKARNKSGDAESRG